MDTPVFGPEQTLGRRLTPEAQLRDHALRSVASPRIAEIVNSVVHIRIRHPIKSAAAMDAHDDLSYAECLPVDTPKCARNATAQNLLGWATCCGTACDDTHTRHNPSRC
jgi:hypothetical protein